jgi:histidyl-tRNA synthetase
MLNVRLKSTSFMISAIKGTHDLLDLTLHTFFIDCARKHLMKYHFQEIVTPLIEPTELFQRSLGQETDVVTKEMFFVTAHGSEEHMCLRPEATASIMRAFVNKQQLTTPWKVFTWGPMFRHERPQKGRYRQFHQLNLEIIGTSSFTEDVYCIMLLDRFFSEELKLDSYALLLNFLGCKADREQFKQQLHAFLELHKAEICSNCLHRKEKNILRVLDCKTKTCQELYKQAPVITDHLCATCAQEWQAIQSLLHQLSIPFSHAPTLVRGLDYYEKIVFEFVSSDLGAQQAFCGGGRYNQLAHIIGAEHDQPSIGAAIGIERIVLLLEEIKDKLPLPHLPPLYLILPLNKEQYPLALHIADTLHAHNLCADILLEHDSLKSMMRKANKMGAHSCIIIGPDEQAAGKATIKNMTTGAEISSMQTDLISVLTT